MSRVTFCVVPEAQDPDLTAESLAFDGAGAGVLVRGATNKEDSRKVRATVMCMQSWNETQLEIVHCFVDLLENGRGTFSTITPRQTGVTSIVAACLYAARSQLPGAQVTFAVAVPEQRQLLELEAVNLGALANLPLQHEIVHALGEGSLKEWPVEVVDLLCANIPNRDNLPAILKEIREETRYLAVVKRGAETVGVLAANGEAHITELAVSQNWRRKGVATLLMRHYALALQASEARTTYYAVRCAFKCFTRVSLNVDYDNPGAIAFYRKCGFTFQSQKNTGYPGFVMVCDVARLLLVPA